MMLKRLLQFLTLAALVNLAYQYWPRGEADELFIGRNSAGKWGFVDKSGRVRIEFEWTKISQFDAHGFAYGWQDGRHGVINRKGEFVIPLNNEMEVYAFDANGYSLAGNRREPPRGGLINTSGKLTVPIEWSWMNVRGENGLREVKRDGKVGFVREADGVAVTPPEWDHFSLPFDGKRYIVGYQNDKRGLINWKGEVVIPPEWNYIRDFAHQEISAAENEDGWKLIDPNGRILVDLPESFTNVGKFSVNGLAPVQVTEGDLDDPDPRMGWIDTSGKIALPCIWLDSLGFDEHGLAAVKNEKGWGWIDSSGKIVIEPEWNITGSFNEHGLAVVLDADENFGVIDVNGRLIVEPVWVAIELNDSSGHIRCRRENGRMGVISPSGEMILEPIWDIVTKFDDRDHVLALREEFTDSMTTAVIDIEGNTLVELNDETLRLFRLYDDNDRMPLLRETDSILSVEGWLDRSGELAIKVPEGDWKAFDDLNWPGVYTIHRERTEELSTLQSWLLRLINWMNGSDGGGKHYECLIYDKNGAIIWSSTWIRKTTKAWLYLFAAFVLLIVLWFGRRKRNSGQQAAKV